MSTQGSHIRLKNKSGKYFDLYHSDCIQGMHEQIRGAAIDIVVTSPPYNLGIRYNTYDDTVSRTDYLSWTDHWVGVLKEKLKMNGSFFLNLGSKPSDPWVPFEVAGVIRKHFVLQNVFHWIKSIYIEDTSYDTDIQLAVGHYKPINSPRYVNDMHEYVFHFTKDGNVPLDRLSIGVPYKDKSNVDRWNRGKEDLRCRGNVWYIPYKTIQSREKERPHPATYPPKLAEMCLKLHGIRTHTRVMDPFMGLGNTALACQILGAHFVGFEKDTEYFKESVQKIGNSLK